MSGTSNKLGGLIYMHKFLIATALVASLCGGCSSNGEPLTAKQAALAKQLKSAPERSLVLFGKDSTMAYAFVCKPTKDEPVRLAYAGIAGVWGCGARYSGASAVEAVQADPIEKIVTPSDPGYSGLLQHQAMKLLGEDETPQ